MSETTAVEVPADGGWHRGDWMQTFTGNRFYPLDPRPEDIDIVDVAHSLAMQCRYNGHVDRFYSVAEHCVLMSRWVEESHAGGSLYPMPVVRTFALEALLHDASEAYCGDMVRPLKHTPEMTPYRDAEDAVMNAIAARHGLLVDDEGVHHKSAVVKDADTRILLTERSALMSHYKPSDRWSMDGMDALPVVIQAWEPRLAKQAYLERFYELTAVSA